MQIHNKSTAYGRTESILAVKNREKGQIYDSGTASDRFKKKKQMCISDWDLSAFYFYVPFLFWCVYKEKSRMMKVYVWYLGIACIFYAESSVFVCHR